jgi:Fe-S cluster assembly protein SufD
MALAKLKMDATQARLADVVLPDGAAWGNAARADALARVQAMGLPTKRDEYWKYTDPASLVALDAPKAALFHNDEGPLFTAVDRVRVVFVDGVFDADASDDLRAEGLEIERLSDAMKTDIHWAKDVYGVLETRGRPLWRGLWRR